MKKIILLLAVMSMTTLMAQANDTMDTLNNAIDKAVEAVTPSTGSAESQVQENQAIEAAKQAAEEHKKEEEEKALGSK